MSGARSAEEFAAVTTAPEPIFVRYTRLTPRQRTQALGTPAARRLLVTRVAHFVDHEHLRPFSTSARGSQHTRVFLILDGSGSIRVRDRSYHLTPGSALVVPALTPNAGQPNRSGWAMWYCDLAGTDVDAVLEAAGIDGDHPLVRPADPHGLAVLLGRIIDCHERGEERAGLLEAVGLGWTFTMRLCADRSPRGGSSPLTRATDHLVRHLADEVRVPDVAALVGLSTPQLQRIFRQSFGTGVRAYHIGLRMERARRLLAQTEQPMARIARAIGYPDPRYFSRRFRKETGQSPTAYRRQFSSILRGRESVNTAEARPAAESRAPSAATA